jgi:hypothetical protein
MSKAQENQAERPGSDPVLTDERDQLRRSREFLHLMREDVLSLHAMGGDPVSEEYLKAELYLRAEALKDIPDTPLFFGRLDYAGPPDSRTIRSRKLRIRNIRRRWHRRAQLSHRPQARARAGRHARGHRLAGAGVAALLPGQRDRPDEPGAAAALRVLRR